MGNKIEKIHNGTMKVLENTGIRILHPDVIELVKKNGVKTNGDIVYFTEEEIMKWIKKAPKKFKIYARNPKYNIIIGGDEVEYSAGYGCPFIADTDGVKRDAKLEDYKNFIKLIHQSQIFNINGGVPVQPGDLSKNESVPIMLYSTIKYSDKCIMAFQGDIKDINRIMDMGSILFGGKENFKMKTRMITLLSTLSPLQIDKDTLDTMLINAENNQAIIITPGPIAGSTGPITLSGNLVLGNAETLAAIAISQMIKEGTPVVYGLLPTTTYMKTGDISIGSPGYALQSTYSLKLAKYYGLPNRSGGAVTDAKCVCAQSGYESMLSMFAARQQGSNFIIHSAGILDAFAAMSYEKFITDLEMISMIDYYLDDIMVDDDSLSVDLIDEVGHGGQFITAGQTYKKCRTEPWNPMINTRDHIEGETPDKVFIKNTQKVLEKMFGNYNQPLLDKEIDKELKDYLLSLKIDQELINKV